VNPAKDRADDFAHVGFKDRQRTQERSNHAGAGKTSSSCAAGLVPQAKTVLDGRFEAALAGRTEVKAGSRTGCTSTSGRIGNGSRLIRRVIRRFRDWPEGQFSFWAIDELSPGRARRVCAINA
jgi:hypothetical protein